MILGAITGSQSIAPTEKKQLSTVDVLLYLQDPRHRPHGQLLEHVVGPVCRAGKTRRHGKFAGVALRLAPAPPKKKKNVRQHDKREHRSVFQTTSKNAPEAGRETRKARQSTGRKGAHHADMP